ncbi:choice-of-anchor L domain-containing protein, partial [Winogradskyella sp. 3972H.M.0a.05]|uniref:choice-of-anchor L domain-containing protein n=1 Tax=Winogradskyella sp. 3972H.M.0a.05 TaxID=2950277 RepID=UPI003391E974
MKKTTLLVLLMVSCLYSYSQVLNQPANWPNANWSVTGVYNTDPTAFEADPTTTANFAFDDDDAGNGNDDDIAAESPVIDLTPAFGAGETWLLVAADYTYNPLAASLTLEYWDADGAAWVAWQLFAGTADQPNDDFCAGARDSFQSDPLDISGFTASQQSGFRYRLSYLDDGGAGGAAWEWGFCFDAPTITSQAPPTCLVPSDLAVGTITAFTAELSWTENNAATSWNVEIVTSGTPPTGVPTATGVTNPYTAMGLMPVVTYDYYVQSDCGGDGLSDWVGPVTFTTLCDVFVPDYTQDFATIIPDCWDEADNGDGTTGPQDLGAGAWTADGFANNGFDGAYKINLWLAEKSDWIISPFFDLTGGPFQVEFDFSIMQFGSQTNAGTLGSDDTVELYITTDNGANWTSLLTFDSSSVVPAGGDRYVVNLAAYSGQTVQFAILGSEGTVDDPEDNDVFVDNFWVRAVPTCPEPSGLTANNLSLTSTEFSWTENGSATSWNVEIVDAGTPPTGVPTATGVTNPYVATGLTSDTSYDVYVQADCGGNGTSIWIGPVNFFTGYCESVPDPVDGNGIAETVVNGTSFPSGGPLGYENFTATPVNAFPGVDLPLEITFETGFTYDVNIWIDFDDNLVFEADELVFQGVSLGDNPTTFDATFLMPIDAPPGQHRMRIGTLDFGAPDPCFNGAFGVTQDFTLEIEALTCVLPEATFTFVSNCPVGTFNVDIDLTDLGSATSITISDNQANSQVVNATGLYTFGPYTNNTDVEITLVNDQDANCTIMSETFNQEFCLDTIVDCNVGPVSAFYCYDNNEGNVFEYTSTDGSPLNLTIDSGEVEGAPFDFLVILDSDGVTELYNGEGNAGDISGLTFQSTGDTIFITVTSDGSVSCASGSFCCSDGINYTVACATCINPEATYVVVDDCDNGDQFLVDVNITSLGDAASVTITDNQGSAPVSVNATGVTQFGPYGFGIDVVFTVSSDDDVNCVINSNPIQLQACPPENDNCVDATVAGVNADNTCDIVNPGTLVEATDSGIPNGSCGGDPDDDVWYQFTALEETQLIILQNIQGGGFFNDLDHAVYEGADCGNLTELYCSVADASIAENLTVGNTYYIRVFSAGGDPSDITFDLCIQPGSGNVVTDQTTYTVEELVEDILIGGECAQISNITWSTGTDFGDVNGIAYFSVDGDGFPFEEGILMTNGDASLADGPNINAMSTGGFAWPGDPDLDTLVEPGGGNVQSNNATIIEFDFVPLAQEISFDFLMASEEYNGATGGTFECTFSDAFAFFLTDENGITTNLAVLPGTTEPILVTNIHPDNAGCDAVNEEYFGGYTPQNLPSTSFDGRTVVFTAQSPVNVGETYHIKLVIGDDADTALDSGVFLEAGSFDLGQLELGDDITIAAGTAACLGEPIILDTQAPALEHVWFLDGIAIPGETSSIFEATEPGVYTAQVIFSSQCIIQDEINVEFLALPEANTPEDLESCSTGPTALFNLTDSDAQVLGAQDPAAFTVTYHLTQQEADDDTGALASPYTNVSNPQTIYVRVEDNVTGCHATTAFNLVISAPSHTADSVDIIECSNDGSGQADFDLDAHNSNVLGTQDPSEFNVSYHNTEDDANNNVNPLSSPYTSSGETVYVRVETVGFADCYVVNSFDLVIGTTPLTSFPSDIDYEVCPPPSAAPIEVTAIAGNYDVSEVSIAWFRDGVPISGNGLTISVTEGGTYSIEVTFNDTGCFNTTDVEVVQLEFCEFPEGISPGEVDGLNDRFDL